MDKEENETGLCVISQKSNYLGGKKKINVKINVLVLSKAGQFAGGKRLKSQEVFFPFYQISGVDLILSKKLHEKQIAPKLS